MLAEYARTHLLPAMILSSLLLLLLYLFERNGVFFVRARQYLDKEVLIQSR